MKQHRTSDLVVSENSLYLGNTFIAGAGNDFITGGPMNDIVKAGSGDDEVYGGEGDDQIFGGKGDDKLDGGGGDDKIFGIKGNDTLYGCRGDDKLNGGKGADIYKISPGNDVFRGFKISEGDIILIGSSTVYSIESFKKHSIIEHDGGSTLVKKVSTSDLENVIRIV